jgi:hypothetical protein
LDWEGQHAFSCGVRTFISVAAQLCCAHSWRLWQEVGQCGLELRQSKSDEPERVEYDWFKHEWFKHNWIKHNWVKYDWVEY